MKTTDMDEKTDQTFCQGLLKSNQMKCFFMTSVITSVILFGLFYYVNIDNSTKIVVSSSATDPEYEEYWDTKNYWATLYPTDSDITHWKNFTVDGQTRLIPPCPEMIYVGVEPCYGNFKVGIVSANENYQPFDGKYTITIGGGGGIN